MAGNVEIDKVESNAELENIVYWRNKSEDYIEAAKSMFNSNSYSESVTLVFYGLLYLTRALFIQDNVHAYKPATVLTALGREYVAPGRIGASFHRNLIQIFDMRYKSDFETGFKISRDTAAHILEQTEELKKEIIKILDLEKIKENIS